MTTTELPNDVHALKELVIKEYSARMQEQQRAELYKYRYELLARRHFGQSSEKRQDSTGQQLLFVRKRADEQGV